LRGGEPDAGAAAGDQHGLVGEIHLSRSPSVALWCAAI
jgi:hypothetical protein